MSAPLLQARGLSVGVPGGLLLDGLDLSLHAGQRLGLVGASGSGKSMAARALLDLLPEGVQRRSGQIDYAGRTLQSARDWQSLRGREIAYVFQDAASSLHPLRRVGAQLSECLRVHAPALAPAARATRIAEMLDAVGLPADANLLARYPHQLSGGQRQRVLLALTLLPQPKILIADEPTSALDPVLAARVCALLDALVERLSMALLFISHDLARVAELCTDVHVLEGGRIVESAPAARVLQQPASAAAQRLAAAVRLPAHQAASAPTAARVLQTEALTLSHPSRAIWPWRRPPPALHAVSLSLARGARIGIVGSSGSGKSTLLRGLLRLLPIRSGELHWFDQAVTALPEPRLRPLRARLQLVFQDPYRSLDPMQRVDAMLREALTFRPAGPLRPLGDPAALLEAVGLPATALQRYPAQFSGGQRQRLAIARALATAPEVLLCDEATSALDSATQAQILDLLDDLARQHGLSLVFVAHDLDAVQRLCDTLIVLEHGLLVESGPCPALLQAPQSAALQALIAARPRAVRE
ncbi:MAG: ABC transporter ATP-binding protein [Lysobacterales bacterium]